MHLFHLLTVSSLLLSSSGMLRADTEAIQDVTPVPTPSIAPTEKTEAAESLPNEFKVPEDLKTKIRKISAATRDKKKPDYAETKKIIARYTKAKKTGEKVGSAYYLFLFQWQIGPYNDLEREDKRVLKEAADYAKSLQKRAEEFEAELSIEQIKEITRDVKHSAFRNAGKVYIVRPFACPIEEYKRVRKEVGEILLTRGLDIMVLSTAYGSAARGPMIERTLHLLQTDKKLAEKRSELVPFYQCVRANLYSSPDKKPIEAAEKNLIQQGIKKADLRRYVADTATLSLPCLAGPSKGFNKFYSSDLLHERAVFLLRQVLILVKNGQRPTDTSGLKVVPNHPIFGSHNDFFERPFHLEYEDKKISISSLGRDGKVGGDDVAVASIPIP